MPLFDADNRLRSDGCAVRIRDCQNASMVKYRLLDFAGSTWTCPAQLSADECAELQNRVHGRSGQGIDVASVDTDSAFRLAPDASTHDRGRQSLASRVFLACPDLGRKGLDTVVEARLMAGGQAPSCSSTRACAWHLAEVDFDRYDPAIQACPWGGSVVVLPFPGGQSSRELTRANNKCVRAQTRREAATGGWNV